MGKERENEDDPAGLRRLAKRIAELKWWSEEPKPGSPAPSEERSEEPLSEEPRDQGGDQQQQTPETDRGES
jgi:hypothetical protein